MRNTRWTTLACLALGALLSACGGRDEKTSAAEERLAPASLPYKGVSLAGAEFGVDAYGNGAVPGTFGVDYIYPDPAYAPGYGSADYFLSKGMTTFRLPFRWERLQPTLFAPFDAAELGRSRRR
jgi:endoglucanase